MYEVTTSIEDLGCSTIADVFLLTVLFTFTRNHFLMMYDNLSFNKSADKLLPMNILKIPVISFQFF
jgi:hypothetical protein